MQGFLSLQQFWDLKFHILCDFILQVTSNSAKAFRCGVINLSLE